MAVTPTPLAQRSDGNTSGSGAELGTGHIEQTQLKPESGP